MISVSEAVDKRKSIRSFIDKPISNELLRQLLEKASRAPSGGNLQPWKIFVINGETMTSFLNFQKKWKEDEAPEYPIYPSKLKDPYRSSRFEVGEQLYSSINISRDDKIGRMSQMMKNFEFFNAPAAIFCFVDRQMNLPQWSDLGMYLQTFMLLAQEEGIDTCGQESWSLRNKMVSSFCEVDDDLMLFTGVAIGYRDDNAPINQYKTSRRPFEDWAKFVDSK